MAFSRRTIRPSPARRIFSKIDTGQRSLDSPGDYRMRPSRTAAARVRASGTFYAIVVTCTRGIPLRANTVVTAESSPWTRSRPDWSLCVSLMPPTSPTSSQPATTRSSGGSCRMIPVPYTEEVARQYVTEFAPARWAAGGAQYAIADPATRRLLGCVGIAPPGAASVRSGTGWLPRRAGGARPPPRSGPPPAGPSGTGTRGSSCAPGWTTGPASGSPCGPGTSVKAWPARPATDATVPGTTW